MRQLVVVIFLFFILCGSVSGTTIFSDVPAGHPALNSIASLAEKGIITGIDSKIFAGQKSVTRYELAMLLLRALAKLEQRLATDSHLLNEDDLSSIEYLKNEFSSELELLGLRVELNQNRQQLLREGVDQLRAQVDDLKKSSKNNGEKIALSGDWLARHTWKSHPDDFAKNAFTGAPRPGNSNNTLTETQIRIRANAKIDENISFSTRFRIFNRGSEAVNAAQSQRGGAFGLNGIGENSQADLLVDAAYLEVKKVFNDNDWFLLGRSTMQNGHGLLFNADFDAIRYNLKFGDQVVNGQYIYDRHSGTYKDKAVVDFRGVINLNFNQSFKDSKYYVGLYAQDEPNLVNRRIANTFKLGTAAGQQSHDSRRDVELGYTAQLGQKKCITGEIAVAMSDYSANIGKPVAGNVIDVDLRGMTGLASVNWQVNKAFSTKLAYSFGNDEFAGGYSLSQDRRYCDNNETNLEDVARGNTWFKDGLKNMSTLKLQVEYKPEGKHYYRVAADFMRELKDQAENDLSHHLAGNPDGVIPLGYVMANSAYDRFNNIGVADPKMQIVNFEYRFQLAKNSRIRVGAVMCDFAGDAFKRVGNAPAISAGRGFKNDYEYNLLWVELFNRF